VHAYADPKFPERAAIVLLNDQSAAQDGLLQPREISQFRLQAGAVVVKGARILRDYSEAGAVNSLIALWGFVDDTPFLTKCGHVGLVYRMHGPDAEGSRLRGGGRSSISSKGRCVCWMSTDGFNRRALYHKQRGSPLQDFRTDDDAVAYFERQMSTD
jgi:hypothetical protein